MFTSHTCEVLGVKSAYYSSDNHSLQGMTIVFLHGRMSEGMHFAQGAKTLVQQGHRLILLDLPGFGASDKPPFAWAIADYATWLDSILTYIQATYNSKDFVLICHSFGGRVAIQALSEKSYTAQHTSKLILLASGGLNTPIHAKFARVVTGTNIVLSHFGALGKTLKSFFHRIAKLFYSSDYHRVSPLLQEIFTKTVKYNQHDLLSKITATTLIIRGDKDNQAPVSDAYYFHKHIIDSELVISPGGSHFAYIDYPEEVLAHISSFIKR